MQLEGTESVKDYLRQCIYDSAAEWQARAQVSRVDPDTVKLPKDHLLRVPLQKVASTTSRGWSVRLQTFGILVRVPIPVHVGMNWRRKQVHPIAVE